VCIASISVVAVNYCHQKITGAGLVSIIKDISLQM